MDEQQSTKATVLVGQHIRELRLAQGISLRKFALMVGIRYPYLSNVENGKQSPTVDVLDRIAKGLDVEIQELF